MMPLLVADCVGKRFGDRRVLTSASLRAVPGELRLLAGRNGAGKSTLLRIAAGWIQPDTGTVHWEGTGRLRVTTPWLARRGLFYLPDHDLLPRTDTLRAHLEILRRRFDSAPVEASAATAGVAHLLDVAPGRISGGELRRAELAAILVRRPRCLLADEPLRGIAPRDAEALLRLFRSLAAGGCAVVVTGHEVRTLLPVVDQVTWCTAGTTHELGSREHAEAHEAFRREYLGRA